MKDLFLKLENDKIVGYFCKLSEKNEKYSAIGVNFDENNDLKNSNKKTIPNDFDFNTISVGKSKFINNQIINEE